MAQGRLKPNKHRLVSWVDNENYRELADVNVQDQTTPVVDLLMFRHDGDYTLASDVEKDAVVFTAEDASGMTVGDVVCFIEGNHFMQAKILSISVNTVTIDTPFDFAFTTGSTCDYGETNMVVNGSVTPQVFDIGVANLGVDFDIVRILFSLTDQSAMDDALFGGISALPRGIVLRATNGIVKNIFNVKTNGEFGLRNYDKEYSVKAPAGFFGFNTRRTFGGQSKNGVVIRLHHETGDMIEIIIQDDLSGLDNFQVVVQGHVVD